MEGKFNDHHLHALEDQFLSLRIQLTEIETSFQLQIKEQLSNELHNHHQLIYSTYRSLDKLYSQRR